MKKSIIFIMSVFALFLAFSMGTYAATKYKFTFDGKNKEVDVQIINKKAYVPLDSIVGLYGGKVAYDNKTKTYAVTSKAPAKDAPASQSSMTKTIKDVTIRIDKVVQDADSLKIYVSYINKSKKEAMTGDSLTKIVVNGKQHGFDFDFNFSRYYDKDVPHAADFIEAGVTEKSVIFFKPVTGDKINIVLNANFEDYRFNDVKIQK